MRDGKERGKNSFSKLKLQTLKFSVYWKIFRMLFRNFLEFLRLSIIISDFYEF